MDIASYLRCFEESLASYSGDDPLDPWDRFVDFLERRQPAGGGSEMSLVFDALVQRFLNVDQYANDVRYVNYCIRCASYRADPATLYAHVFSRGVGSRTAALYLAWARHFEQKGMKDQADAVYLKALENQAQPEDTLLHEYRQFQSRTRTEPPASGARVPLQNSQLTNQMSPQKKVPVCYVLHPLHQYDPLNLWFCPGCHWLSIQTASEKNRHDHVPRRGVGAATSQSGRRRPDSLRVQRGGIGPRRRRVLLRRGPGREILQEDP
uniref:BUB1 N-terminal domain-containing protein n=1 Tax=Poecilia reticulata TaxID=8081 RepID=A0A3P9PH98_POERE